MAVLQIETHQHKRNTFRNKQQVNETQRTERSETKRPWNNTQKSAVQKGAERMIPDSF